MAVLFWFKPVVAVVVAAVPKNQVPAVLVVLAAV